MGDLVEKRFIMEAFFCWRFMEKINLNDFDFSNNYIKEPGFENGIVYSNDKERIKMLLNIPYEDKEILLEKLETIEKLNVDGVILPKTLIMYEGYLDGYIMEYPLRAKSFDKMFTSHPYEDIRQMLIAIKRASLVVRNMHKNNIVANDISLNNFVMDINGNVFFTGIETSSYDTYSYPYISKFLKDFIGNKEIDITKDTDKLLLVLNAIYLFYLKDIRKLSKIRYRKISKDIQSLQNIEKYAMGLRKKNIDIEQLPYIDELLDLNDYGYLKRI